MDFDADKSMQYNSMWLSLSKIYNSSPEIPNYMCFGPASVAEMPSNFNELSVDEQKLIKNVIKTSQLLQAEIGQVVRYEILQSTKTHIT